MDRRYRFLHAVLIFAIALCGHSVNAADNGVGSPVSQLPSFGFDNSLPSRIDAATEIRYRVPGDGPAAVEVYDINGQRVVLVTDILHAAGARSVVWDVKDLTGAPLSSGVYFIRLTSGEYSEIRKIIVIRQ